MKDLDRLGLDSSGELNSLLGAEIQNIGFDEDCPNDGLGIDYIKDGVEFRLVLGFTNIGMWIHRNSQRDSKFIDKEKDIRTKIQNFIDNCENATNLVCEGDALNRLVSIVSDNNRLNLSLSELKFLPRDIVDHIRGEVKNANEFIFSLQMSDWLFI